MHIICQPLHFVIVVVYSVAQFQVFKHEYLLSYFWSYILQQNYIYFLSFFSGLYLNQVIMLKKSMLASTMGFWYQPWRTTEMYLWFNSVRLHYEWGYPKITLSQFERDAVSREIYTLIVVYVGLACSSRSSKMSGTLLKDVAGSSESYT